MAFRQRVVEEVLSDHVSWYQHRATVAQNGLPTQLFVVDCALRMRRTLRFIVPLVGGLALLTWVASLLIHSTTRDWFVKDVRLRSELAARGAHRALVSRWTPERRADLARLLEDITHDERILAAAACSKRFDALAKTSDYPGEVGCEEIGRRVERGNGDADRHDSWNAIEHFDNRDLHLSVIPVRDDGAVLGFVVLVHDMSFVEQRMATTRRFLIIAFGLLALAASAISLIAARLSRRGWAAEFRRSLRDGPPRPEFQPILRDVRELVDRLVADKESGVEQGAWTRERLQQTLSQHLPGERIVVLANREPYVHEHSDEGIKVLHPASGLVTALEPVVRACSGIWIAHASGSADRETADRHDRVRVPPGEESYVIRRVWLSAEQERGYYYGFSNEGLWPLCHIAHTRPVFRSDDWQQYQDVNQKFADTVCSEVDRDDPIVLVQDYHLALAPRLIRNRLPNATIIMFWHIPWPNSERFGICPWSDELLEGMLGASILGFHTHFHCNNFTDSVDRFLEARIDREQQAVIRHGRSTLVRPYPISIEWPVRWLEGLPPDQECQAMVRAELGLPPDVRIGMGVDRLDYTKGVEERLLAVERLLERVPALRGRFTFVQLAAPSRTIIERYRKLNEAVNELATRINRRFPSERCPPVILLREHHEPQVVFRYYRAADFCYVSSLHDGMNLVAKEFVAAREDERGVLVLSRFTGAARELTEALVVNPYDLDEASAAMHAALEMSPNEQRARMRSMRTFVSDFNVYRWAGKMLVDASRLRSRDRLVIRLADHRPLAASR